MKIYKVLLKTTNAMKDCAYDFKSDKHIDVIDGYIYVTADKLEYVIESFDVISIEKVGILYERRNK